MNEIQRTITDPNVKVEVTKTLGKYAKTEVIIGVSGNLNELFEGSIVLDQFIEKISDIIGNKITKALEKLERVEVI